MYYCPKCGESVENINERCPHCGYMPENEILGEAVEKESKILNDRADYAERGPVNDPYDNMERFMLRDLSGVVKALLVVLAFVNVFLGFIAAVVLLTRPYPRYKSFGIKLLLLCIVIFVFSLIFGLFNAVLGIVAMGLRQITG
ncbi:hypothetical protein MUJ63_06600 [Lachnospiraceae bacterium NSJ-143]|nr:hypothetical protein [Lachnospiraceae bacterium NSJ-143]